MAFFDGDAIVLDTDAVSTAEPEAAPEASECMSTTHSGQSPSLRLDVSRCGGSESGDPWAHLRVIPPSALPAKKENVHFIFVVDVSGSMGTDVEAVGADGKRECNGFSILDLVKHSLLTVVNSLDAAHMVTLISFSDAALVELESVRMSKSGIASASVAIKALQPTACTNLWAGLQKGYDVVKESSELHPKFRSEIMLFTDGMPNVEPPRGHIPTIQRYLACKNIPTAHCVRTYGFGYSLHSKLLEQIAVLGRGSFSFIPDASLVGTIFIHAVADILASVPNVQNLKLRVAKGSKLVGLESHQELGFVSSDCTVKLPFIEYFLGNIEVGQPRDFIVMNPDFACLELRYVESNENIVLNARDFIHATSDVRERALPHLARLEACDMIRQMLDGALSKKQAAVSGYGSDFGADKSGISLQEKEALVSNFVKKFESRLHGSSCAEDGPKLFMGELNSLDESFAVLGVDVDDDAVKTDDVASTTDRSTASLMEGVIEDLKGQVTEAVETDQAYRRWGVFYLRSLAFAHQLQKRNNFKDFGVQHYGGEIFDKEVDRVNDIFDTLPPPEASNKGRNRHAVAVTTMSSYNNCYGGCFLPNCVVTMREGSYKRCESVRQGDYIRTAKGHIAKVLCVVKIIGSNMMCIKLKQSGLGITPWHPMLMDGEWVFPAEYAENLSAAEVERVPTQVVYNFMLESAEEHVVGGSLACRTAALSDHTMLINGVPAVTFGHGMETNAVVKHSYWGNMTAMLRDMTVMIGWNAGFIVLQSETACVKDPDTGLVVKMVQQPVISNELTCGCEKNTPKHVDSLVVACAN